jgi:hypothetical protein
MATVATAAALVAGAARSFGYRPDGKRDRRKVSGQTKAEVKDKLKELHADLDVGVKTSADYSVQRAVDDWMAEGRDGLSVRTTKRDKSILKPVLAIVASKPLHELATHDVRRALTVLARDHSSSTVTLARNRLVLAIQHAEAGNPWPSRRLGELASIAKSGSVVLMHDRMSLAAGDHPPVQRGGEYERHRQGSGQGRPEKHAGQTSVYRAGDSQDERVVEQLHDGDGNGVGGEGNSQSGTETDPSAQHAAHRQPVPKDERQRDGQDDGSGVVQAQRRAKDHAKDLTDRAPS